MAALTEARMAVIGHHCPTTTTLSSRLKLFDDTPNGYGALAGTVIGQQGEGPLRKPNPYPSRPEQHILRVYASAFAP